MSEDFNYTDSTNIASMDSEKKKEFIEFNDNCIHKLYNTVINEQSEFIEPGYPLTFKDVIQNTYLFKQEILRVWLILRSFEFLLLINNKGHYPCINIKGQNTWDVGNQFKGSIFGKNPFVAKVQKSIDYPEMKKIKWIFDLKNGHYFSIKLELFKVTENNTTVVLKKVKFDKSKLDFHDKMKEADEIRIFKILERILENEPINLLKYESGIIEGKMEDVWNLILDFNQATAICPNNNFLPNISIKDLKVGEKIKASIYGTKNDYKDLDITLLFREETKNWNKWQIIIEASGGYPMKIPRHTLLLQLTKINNNECQLTLLTKFHEPIDNDIFKELSNRKKYIILCLKDYFENFYSPSSS